MLTGTRPKHTGPQSHSFLEAAWTWATASPGGTSLPGHHGLQPSGLAWPGLRAAAHSRSAGPGEWPALEMLSPPQPFLSSQFPHTSSRKPSLITPLGEEATPRGHAAWIPPQICPQTPFSYAWGGLHKPRPNSELLASRPAPCPALVLPPLHITAQMSLPRNPSQAWRQHES